MTTLISFLGRGDRQKGYRSANYVFANAEEITSKYIGLALIEHIKPERVIMLGTTGSMWDVFFEHQNSGTDEQLIQLIESIDKETLTQDQLVPFSEYLSDRLGTVVECVLIPHARDEREQVEILSNLSNRLDPRESVILDVTHGFRHLPMLALVAARFLQKTKQITVEQIYYGALEMTTKKEDKTPVLLLSSMLTLLDWVEALSSYDKDGDYSVFADLLQKDGLAPNMADQLRQAAFFERTTNSSKAAEKIGTVLDSLDKMTTPVFDLFKSQLQKRLNWAKTPNRGLREQRLARAYLERRDYLRAVIYGLEGMISSQIAKIGGSPNDFEARHTQKEWLRMESESFKRLNQLRNSLAHGNQPESHQRDALAALADERRMQQSLKDRFDHLLD
jgi:CRISPR-associated Csx2 family protein